MQLCDLSKSLPSGRERGLFPLLTDVIDIKRKCRETVRLARDVVRTSRDLAYSRPSMPHARTIIYTRRIVPPLFGDVYSEETT